jgi:hypothetical protein
VKYRVNGFRDGEMPNKSTVQQVQKLHDSVPKSYIVSASLSAAAFYDWVNFNCINITNISKIELNLTLFGEKVVLLDDKALFSSGCISMHIDHHDKQHILFSLNYLRNNIP